MNNISEEKLSWGDVDFIEESASFSDVPLTFKEGIEISEDESECSPFHILGKARGCFAPIGEFSRNKRLYSESLWPTVLQNEELKSRLASRSVFGCLGHADKLVDDRDIQEGKVSHIVTLLEVRNDQKTGKPYLYGELEILDTPAGRILEAMYKGGANLYVSSRAAGKLIPVPGQNYSMVKPDQYHMHTFDIVCRPGFLQAHPMFESASTNESVNEEDISETSKELKSKVAALRQIDAENANKEENDILDKHGRDSKEYKEAHQKTNDAINKLNKFDRHSGDIIKSKEYKELGGMYEAPGVVRKKTDESIEELKSQLNQLTKIIEKVVDDVYEEAPEGEREKEMEKKSKEAPQMQEQPIAPVEEAKKENKTDKKVAIPAFLAVMAESNISAEALSEIIDMIKGDISND